MPTNGLILDAAAEGGRIGLIGKGGSGKSTIAGHLLGHFDAAGIPCTAFDSDEPGEGESGSLYAWSLRSPLGGPVYRTPDPGHIRPESERLTPANGVGLFDTGAWERRSGNAHFAVLGASDLVVLCLQPTFGEVERAGSITAAFEQLISVGIKPPKLAILLTMTNPSAASAGETREDLSQDFHVLKTEIPRSDAHDGYAQSMKDKPRAVNGSPMHLLAAELLDVLAEARTA